MHAGDIVARAEKLTGLSADLHASFWEGLELLVRAANAYPHLTEAGRETLSGMYVDEVVNRLRVDNWIETHPGLADTPVERPIFVCGIPRSGTTLLSYLLGQDPENRALLNWEAMESVPPPTAETLHTDPRCLAKIRLKAEQLAADPARGQYHWEAADGPTECVFVHAQDFRGGFVQSSFPMQEYHDWWIDREEPMLSAYRYQKRVLQVLQTQAPGQWSLKAPSHAMFLRQLVQVFPDAIILWIHRDPVPVVGSFCSLIRRNQSNYTDPVDTAFIGRNCLWQAKLHAERPTEFRTETRWDRVFDVSYANLVRDPIGEMERVYDHLDRPLTDEAASAMSRWLAENPQNKFGKHNYDHADFGLTQEQIRDAFAEYVDAYQIEVEG